MILIDTSAWIEFLRDTGSPACQHVDSCSRERSRCATPSAWRSWPVPATTNTSRTSVACSPALRRSPPSPRTTKRRRSLSDLSPRRRNRSQADRLPHRRHRHQSGHPGPARRHRLRCACSPHAAPNRGTVDETTFNARTLRRQRTPARRAAIWASPVSSSHLGVESPECETVDPQITVDGRNADGGAAMGLLG